MSPIRTAVVACTLALFALTGFAAAQTPDQPTGMSDRQQPSYSLVGGCWMGDQIDSQGRKIALGFRGDGGCIMIVSDAATGKILGQSTGTFSLIGDRITMSLSVAEIRGTLT